ncbi:hypothetical protein LQW54_004595 [Pestalotiopsis sp. IQ-011]
MAGNIYYIMGGSHTWHSGPGGGRRARGNNRGGRSAVTAAVVTAAAKKADSVEDKGAIGRGTRAAGSQHQQQLLLPLPALPAPPAPDEMVVDLGGEERVVELVVELVVEEEALPACPARSAIGRRDGGQHRGGTGGHSPGSGGRGTCEC